MLQQFYTSAENRVNQPHNKTKYTHQKIQPLKYSTFWALSKSGAPVNHALAAYTKLFIGWYTCVSLIYKWIVLGYL